MRLQNLLSKPHASTTGKPDPVHNGAHKVLCSVCSIKSQQYTQTMSIQTSIGLCVNIYVQENNAEEHNVCSFAISMWDFWITKWSGSFHNPHKESKFSDLFQHLTIPSEMTTELHASQKWQHTERTAVWKTLLNLLNRCSLNFHWSSTCLVISSWEKEQYHFSNLKALFLPILQSYIKTYKALCNGECQIDYLLLGMQYLQKIKVRPWFFIKCSVELITSTGWL